MVITGLAPGWPPQAIVAACGLEERTGADGLARAGRQGPTVHALLGEPPRDLGQVQAAAIRVQNQGGLRWWALARMIRTRGGLAGEVSAPRARRLSRRRIARVRRGAAPRPLLVGIDGLKADVRTLRKTFRDPVRPGPPGRPRRHAWQTLCRAPVGQRDAPRRGGDGERRMVDDTPARLERRRHRSPGPGVSNTADLAPLNAML